MFYGLVIFPTDYSISPAEVAQAAEERGFERLLFPEHTHIPASRESPWPAGGELPKEYSHCLDPFVAMTAAAMATQTLKVGTGISLVIEHDPIVLAKQVASLDHVSGGRMLFGIGAGWNKEEMANHGTEFSTRWRLLRERVEAMKAIWTEDEASYHGKYVNFDRIWSWPKPIQRPHPPILMGGDGERTLPRVVRYADEWMPLGRGGRDFGPRIAELQQLASEAGRGPIPVSIFIASTKPEVLEQYRKDGVSGVLFSLPSEDRDGVLARMDTLVQRIREFEGG